MVFPKLYGNEIDQLYPLPEVPFYNSSGEKLPNDFAGGMLKPQFSNIDLNRNGHQDIIVFDRDDGSILPFLRSRDGERYVWAPQYQENFPDIRNFALFRDFNNNGKKDLFTYSPGGSNGIRVYRNISSHGELAFEKVTDQLTYPGDNNPVNLFLLSSDIPVIRDIDGDGGLDILTFDPLGMYVNFYKNVGAEEFDNPDTLAFDLVDRCWGRFLETQASPVIELGVYADFCVENGKNKAHQGATMEVIDMDGTGDKDLIMGDVENRDLSRLVNGKNSHFNEPYPVDTMVELKHDFPESHPVDIGFMPAPYRLNVTGNEKMDLVAAPNDGSNFESLNQVWLYENVGDGDTPEFEFRQDDFLQNTMLDLGFRSAPAFFDYNGNGLRDLLIATGANQQGLSSDGGRLVLFLNEGEEGDPEFSLEDLDFLNISGKGWNDLNPAFGDISGNGREDLLLGRALGDLIFFENTASQGEEANFQSPQTNFEGVQVNGFSKPYLYDLTENQEPDLFLGKQNGEISYYENDGNEFKKVTEHWGGIKANSTFDRIIYDDDNNPVDTVEEYFSEGLSAPALTDITGDGETEVIVGSMDRELLIYEVGEEPEDSFEVIPGFIHSLSRDTSSDFDQGNYLVPAVLNEGGEHNPFLFLGNNRGGLFAFGPDEPESPTNIDEVNRKPHGESCFRIYPNPAKHLLRAKSLASDITGEVQARLMSTKGEVIKEKTLNNLDQQTLMDVSDVPAGIYLLSIGNERCREVERVVVE